MNRRELIAGLGSAAAWPMVARAQQSDKIRRVGVLMGYLETDPEAQERLITFRRGLATLGWSEGSNLHIDVRWSSGAAARATSLAKELVALQPNAILAHSTPVTTAIQHTGASIEGPAAGNRGAGSCFATERLRESVHFVQRRCHD